MNQETGFSKEWNEQYSQQSHLSLWPWSELVSLTMRYIAKQDSQPKKILELGCGAGANIAFFLNLGWDYHALEGSSFIVQELKNKYPQLKNKIHVADFTKGFPTEEKFDVIVDRGALTHNTSKDIISTLENIKKHLSQNGFFIGVDWFSDQHSHSKKGVMAEEECTRTGMTEGPFANVGRVHFFSETHLKDLLKDFELIHLDHKRVDYLIPKTETRYSAWNLVAKKKDEGNAK